MIQAAGLMLSGLLVAGTAYAGDQKAPQAAEPSVTVQGVQVAIDPTTGQLVTPTAAQRAALSRAMVQQPAASRDLRSRGILDSSAAPADEAAARKTFHTFRLKNGHEAVGMSLPESLMRTSWPSAAPMAASTSITGVTPMIPARWR
jgi:hypothetical protein